MENIISKPTYKGAGVYAIINIDKNKCYIGQTDNVKNRISIHISMLKHNRHYSQKMQTDYNNGDRFDIKLLEKTQNITFYHDDRKRLECYYIGCLMRAGVPLYNRIPEFSSKDFFFWSLYVDKKFYNLVKNIKEGV